MTITLKSNPDGVSGAIQVNGVDSLTVNSSGAVTASTNPATGLRSTALATMQKFADEFGSSLASSGYQKLPSGLIIQWGTLSGSTNVSAGSFNYPIAFPSAIYSVVGTMTNQSTGTFPTAIFLNQSASLSSCQYTLAGMGSGGAYSLNWTAIGR